MEGMPEWLKYVTPTLAFTALAGVGLKVLWDYVRGKRRNGDGGSEMLGRICEELRSLTQKLDELRIELVGNYARRESLDAIGTRLDEVRERTVRVETKLEVIERQISKLFEKTDGGE